ncbi:hypothetical protein GEMRC1_001470 [Eukaryota sp. GEM-RC1]
MTELSELRKRLRETSSELVEFVKVKRKLEEKTRDFKVLTVKHQESLKLIDQLNSDYNHLQSQISAERRDFKTKMFKYQSFYERVNNNSVTSVQTDLKVLDLNQQLQESEIILKGKDILTKKLKRSHTERESLKTELESLKENMLMLESVNEELNSKISLVTVEAEKYKTRLNYVK